MRYFRNIIYLSLLACCAPVLLIRAIRDGKYREGWAEKFLGSVKPRASQAPCVWFHAVSVGEIKVLERVVGRFRQRFPDHDVVISTTTATGRKVASTQFADLTVIYCPLDFSWAVRRAVARVKPTFFVLAELEIWPNLIEEMQRQGASIALINGRLSDRSFRGYRRMKALFASTFRRLDFVGVQSSRYASRFQSLGVDPCRIAMTGSLKFDGVLTDRRAESVQAKARLAGIRQDDLIWLAGSTQPEEDEMALSVFEALAPRFPSLRLILVPRHPERFDETARKIMRTSLPWARRSKFETDRRGIDAASDILQAASDQPGHADPSPNENWRILLVDSVGELGDWWGSADVAYVGGSMGRRGGQNMIEPAAFGAAVSFGPKTGNFRDVVHLLLDEKAAVCVDDAAALESFVEQCIEDPSFRRRLGQRAQELVTSQRGAADRTIEALADLLQDANANDSCQEAA